MYYRCRKTVRACEGNERWGYIASNTRGCPGVITCTIYQKMAAQMEGNYSMTLKMGLGY